MSQLYRCQCLAANAVGHPSPNGFTVLKGSVISERITASFEIGNYWYYKLRLQLISDGIIQDQVFRQDYEFKSRSAAAAVVLGRTGGGNKTWQPIPTETEESV